MDTKTLSQRALEIAVSQIGVTEAPDHRNDGVQVEAYLKSVGLGKGLPWCMAFMYWIVSKAAKDLNVANPLVQTGGVLDQWNRTQVRKLPNRSTAVKPGDIFIMEFSHGNGHTGMVERVEGGVIHTIEGNTNEDGSREGYEVARRERTLSSILGFIQLP